MCVRLYWWRISVRLTSSTLLLFLAVSSAAQTPAPQNSEPKKSEPPTKRLFIADYILRPNKGSSTLYKKNGDVVYVSHAKVKVSNLVKDVCGYIQSHP